MIKTFVQELIGIVPSPQQGNTIYNYEIIEYMVCAIVLIFMLSLVYRMILSIFGRN